MTAVAVVAQLRVFDMKLEDGVDRCQVAEALWTVDLPPGVYRLVLHPDDAAGVTAVDPLAGKGFDPVQFRFVTAPKELQDALIAYHNTPADAQAAALIRAVLDAYGVAMDDCGNAECNWRGPISECSHIGTVGPCCPQCREIVEPDAPGAAGNEKCPASGSSGPTRSVSVPGSKGDASVTAPGAHGFTPPPPPRPNGALGGKGT